MKVTLSELDEEEAELEKLKSWHGRIGTRDEHRCDRAGDAEAAREWAGEAPTR